MLQIGIIAEGPTDQAVIENILIGYCVEEPIVKPIYPPRPLGEQPGGWGNVLQCLRRGDYRVLIENNIDYLVIHIDCDKQDDSGFDVPRRENGKELSAVERIDRVIARLNKEIDPEFLKTYGARIIYAVAVDSIECWLLPIFFTGNRASKITGCEAAVDDELRRLNQQTLSQGDRFRNIQRVSKPYTKRRDLQRCYPLNPSFEQFLLQLQAKVPQPDGNVASTATG